ncbi:hypothetical protein Tco_1501810 [Tanacetum coccineum]
MDSSTSSQANQLHSPLNHVTLDMDFDPLMTSLCTKKPDESEEETQEQRPIGRDRAKKKSFASSREGSLFVDLVADKFFNIKSEKWGKMKEQQDSYIQLKNQELDIPEAARREATDLKRE